MTIKQRNSNARLIVAIALFAAALISALAITALGNQRQSYWAAGSALAPGMKVAERDLVKVEVALGNRAELYLSTENSPVGATVIRSISQGELLSISALEDSGSGVRVEQVPLTLRGGDIPVDIQVGEQVNIYWVPDPQGNEVQSKPILVLRHIFLQSIDRKNSNFGTDIAITILVQDQEVISLLKATISGRIVVVRSYG
jgi:hypothetical protein